MFGNRVGRCAPSSIFCVRKRRPLPTPSKSDKTSGDQPAAIGEIDEVKIAMKIERLQKVIGCMKSSHVSHYRRCMLQYYN